MLNRLTSKDYFLIEKFVQRNLIFFGYIVPNIERYGFDKGFFSVYYSLDDNGEVNFVGTNYHNTMHVFSNKWDNKLLEDIKRFKIENNIRRITGNAEFVEAIHDCINESNLTKGLLYQLDNSTFITKYDVYSYQVAKTKEEFDEIAKLLCQDESFSKNYNVEDLSSQLMNRSTLGNGRTIYCKLDNQIVGSVSTYAECKDICVISGVVTKNGYKRKGIGSYLLQVLKAELLFENKTIILYFYEDYLLEFYKQLGIAEERQCAKLEFF